MRKEVTIRRVLLSLIVAGLYLIMSSTVVVHGMSHASTPKATSGISADGDCFFCYHGPANSLASVPSNVPSAAAAYDLIDAIAALTIVDVFDGYEPPLRAPPSFS